MSVELHGAMRPDYDQVLNPEALALVEQLHRRFDGRRRDLLAARPAGRRNLGFLSETQSIREGDWTVAPTPDDLQQRWVEITGPTDAKLVINALNSGADGFMADFEDANAPTWTNMVEGQLNVRDAIDRTLTHDDEGDKHYSLNDEVATLLIRPRGWHLTEKHVSVDGDPVPGGLFDFALYLVNSGPRLLANGSAPYFYLPKLEHHLEARLWAEVFTLGEEVMGIPRGTCKATVLIETLPAAFQMDEILYELRDHSAGLNAGRWDYIFSAIKCQPDTILPDRSDVTMTVPFMSAYTERLVAICHRRAVHAMGGMAAQIPSRKDPDAAEAALAKVREDKEREVGQGYDGTWVAHPDAVSAAREVFEQGLGGQPNQIARQRDDVDVTEGELLDLESTPGGRTEAGLRNDVNVGFQYVSFWLTGMGAAGINGMMEDAATAEISRSQIWQWVHHGITLDDGPKVTPDYVRQVLDEETAKIRDAVGDEVWEDGRPEETREV
ncbi:MAG TPA: malate synthase A, partial [Solirubrobacteraceae bacterium]